MSASGDKNYTNNNKYEEKTHNRATNIHLKHLSQDSSTPDNILEHSAAFPKEKEATIVNGEYKILQLLDEVALDCKTYFIAYGEINSPFMLYYIPPYAEFYAKLRDNGTKIKVLTEITPENIEGSKWFIKNFNPEMRHLDGLKGNFALSENLYIAANMTEESKPAVELIRSDATNVIQQYQYIFDTLWHNAVPIEQKIKEIEEGILPPKTKILDKPEEIVFYISDLVEKTKVGVSTCAFVAALEVMDNYNSILEAYKTLVKRHKEGKIQNGVRFLTHIGNNNNHVELVKKFLKIGFSIRHLNNLPTISFMVSENQLESTIENMEGGQIAKNLLYSTEPLYIQHYQSFFEELWDSSINAEDRIRQIESGIALEHTRVIENPVQTKHLLFDLVNAAKKEIMILFSSSNAIKRQANMGLIDLLKQKSTENVIIKILFPGPKKKRDLSILKYFFDNNKNIENVSIREIANQDDLKSSIVLVDRKYVLTAELKDDAKNLFEEAIGLATYSTSKPTILSYISIFDSLWNQTETYETLRIANQKLLESEQIERDFINTAAHELRTPTQAITGYSEFDDEVFKDLIKNKNQIEKQELERIFESLHSHHKGISRNATRLNNLISNLLDVARIDSNQKNMILLDKENFDIIKDIQDLVDFQLKQKLKDKNININLINQALDAPCLVFGDRSRVDQVLSNLLENAIKFSKKDSTIDILIQYKKEKFHEKIKEKLRSIDQNRIEEEIIYIAITDSGKGISPDILPRLFEKFMTNSDSGTGLGLYISKKLVEAMGGKIWAFNNSDGVGSTFIFSLPLTANQNSSRKTLVD
ncbi:MAG TPA: HAMP domain-containing sensor histidine kinase [Candidatus Nitrosocosmicus sp.]|nr:HAMP domain-containing sensor histidine kinase [Candidatus Nitrosocosmicus sp.]